MSGFKIVVTDPQIPVSFTETGTVSIFGHTFSETISFNPTCFASGTLVRTTIGDVAVEDLKIGNSVVTASGAARPIKWVGRRTIDCETHPSPETVQPIRIQAGAFGCGRPCRDLMLSPHHAVAVTCVDEVLIPIRLLINGGTIAQVNTSEITYWHVELDSHDILLANGLPAESYLDVGNRAEFEGETPLVLHPEFNSETAAGYCRPFVTGGPVLSAVRTQLSADDKMQQHGMTSFHLLVDDEPVTPIINGHNAAFFVPAGTRDIRLVSPSWSPKSADPDSTDVRTLGVLIQSLAIDDLVGNVTDVPLDNRALLAGFHPLERVGIRRWRWTDGDALIDASSWGRDGAPFVLRLTGQFAFQAASAVAEAA